MTIHVYRFRRQLPADVSTLESLAGIGISSVDHAGGAVFDLQIDDSKAVDLVEALERSGFSLLHVDPTTPATADVVIDAAGTDNVLIDDITECPIVDDVLGNLMVDL